MQVLKDYFSLLRPAHWIKNFFLFAAPFFGGALFSEATFSMALPAFLTFSLCASAGYILNDVSDAESDKLHHEKKKRAVASGSIRKENAWILAVFLGVFSLVMALKISLTFLFFVLLYFSIQLTYSFYLKHIPIVDIFCISSGFVIRVLAGGVAFHVQVSQWLLVTMFMISLVLAAGKRIGEINTLNDKAEEHRKSLTFYSSAMLDEILIVASAASLIAYALYTIEQFHRLVFTVPIVTFGLFRYLLLSKQGLGDPTDAMIRDKWLASTVVIWLMVVGIIRYT
ncbi:MAG TPA: decaprenyl-phosphate phosphoribosyltransferase [Thermodesulfovibrionales bacterium]|nr:decaprenyl-phosphate phosphoribosyltransferase [Thermodesulfovibrionales bacterium]